MGNNDTIFAFDVGKKSLGICARQGDSILELDAHLFETTKDTTVGNIDAIRTRRRAYRTRLSHKAREAYLQKIWLECGYELPDMSSPQMTKEFAKAGETTLYTSCMLRVALLQEQPLEPWQIYKALWSAIQRRGYDNVPWGAAEQRKHKTKESSEETLSEPSNALSEDDKENMAGLEAYQKLMETYVKESQYFLPCYLEAALLNLWSPEKPNQLINTLCSPTTEKVRGKGRVAPRNLVENECRSLLKAAAKQLTQLAGKEELILYGPAEKAYASYHLKNYKRFRGTQWDWQGVLSQKVPRFDNRIIAKCQLMPERNVCKGHDTTNLEVKILFALKNFRYTNLDGEVGQSLTPQQIVTLFSSTVKKKAFKDQPAIELPLHQKATQMGGINASDLRSLLKAQVPDFADTKVEAIKLKHEGRSRFCRPALKILKDILLSGQNPPEFDITPYVQSDDPKRGITEDEVRGQIRRLGDTWQNIHIGDDRNEALELAALERRKKILWTIGSVNNPVVRHRLTWFWNTLKRLESKHGIPQRVILEFIRDGKDNSLEGQKKAAEAERSNKLNEKYNDDLAKELMECGLSPKLVTKLKLLNQQGGHCIYTGESITPAMLDTPLCQVDHIVPVSMGGNDELANKVLCTSKANQEKGDRTPYEWLNRDQADKNRWAEYKERVEQAAQNRDSQRKMGYRKQQLLLSANAAELIASYNALAETAYIARLAQKIVALQFGWPLQVKDQSRRIFVSNGKNTALIRRVYRLDQLLYTDAELEQIKQTNKPVKKNRDNEKHHALDSYCISYSQDLKYKYKADGDIAWFVDGLSRPALEEALDKVIPEEKRRASSSKYPEETIYGLKQRVNDQGKTVYYLTVMKPLLETFADEKDPKKLDKKIWDEAIKYDLMDKAASLEKAEWKALLENYHHPKRKSRVRRVCVIVSESELPPRTMANGHNTIGEYCDFGHKGTSGQFKRGKKHQGQILFTNPKGSVKVMPVYSFQQLTEARQRLTAEGNALYLEGHMFSSGSMIQVDEFKSGKSKTYPSGIYKLRTIITGTGAVLLESPNGQEVLTSVTYLTQAKLTPYVQALEPIHS